MLTSSEQQCNLLRLELQRLQTEKEILKVRFMEEKLLESPLSDIKYIDLFCFPFDSNSKNKIFLVREIDNIDYEKIIRNELDINIDQTNKLIK